MVEMAKISDLKFGFGDAENYKSRAERSFFNAVFTRNSFLEDLLKETSYFLMGEKGTGKTAYAVYLSNNNYKNNLCQIKYIRETDYRKFISLKRSNHLDLADYTSIWKVILLLLLAEKISKLKSEISNNIFSKSARLRALIDAIDDYYDGAFDPQVMTVLDWVQNNTRATDLVVSKLKLAGSQELKLSGQETRFQNNLFFLERQFKQALSELKLKNSHILFIDGIDIRPGKIDYDEYLECIKGLVNAVWSLNSDFFSNIRDSKGRLRVVLLIRPDIFMSVEMQNSTNKARDNSVFLDWRTTYPNYRNSKLFELADNLFSAQQGTDLPAGTAWDYYLPWKSNSTNINLRPYDDSFISFLRLSYSRPRDVVTALQYLQDGLRDSSRVFREKDFTSHEFTAKYSEYLMGSLRDQLSFYYNQSDYELFRQFFTFLNGKSEFSYEEYLSAYSNFESYILRDHDAAPKFLDKPEGFIQFMYNANIICYIDRTVQEPLFRFCYRERSPSNIEPKVGLGKQYRIHYGLYKALNVGPYGFK
jgi:hypothetical protein